MPDAFTTNLALIKPENGASRDTWGTKTNANWDVVDEFIAMQMPIGAVLDFAGPNAPAGWLICDGRMISRTTYSDLFAVIGTHWGAGDGSTTFVLPNTPGRASVGTGTVTDGLGNAVPFSFGQTAGFVNNYIQKANLPNITLTAGAAGQHSHGNSTGIAGAHNHTTDSQGDHSHTVDSPTTTGPVTVAFGGFGIGGSTTTSINGAHTHNVSYVDNHAHGIITDGSHTHLVPLGGNGSAFSVLSPVIVVTKIIYAGQQAAPALSTTTLEATPTRRLLSAPMRGSH